MSNNLIRSMARTTKVTTSGNRSRGEVIFIHGYRQGQVFGSPFGEKAPTGPGGGVTKVRQPNVLDVDRQSVAGLRALYVDRSRGRIGGFVGLDPDILQNVLGSANPSGRSIPCFGDNAVARIHPDHGGHVGCKTIRELIAMQMVRGHSLGNHVVCRDYDNMVRPSTPSVYPILGALSRPRIQSSIGAMVSSG